MSMTNPIADDQAMRAVIGRLLRERSDATPSDIVELLGDYVIWGPLDPPADTAEPVADEPESAFAAA